MGAGTSAATLELDNEGDMTSEVSEGADVYHSNSIAIY